MFTLFTTAAETEREWGESSTTKDRLKRSTIDYVVHEHFDAHTHTHTHTSTDCPQPSYMQCKHNGLIHIRSNKLHVITRSIVSTTSLASRRGVRPPRRWNAPREMNANYRSHVPIVFGGHLPVMCGEQIELTRHRRDHTRRRRQGRHGPCTPRPPTHPPTHSIPGECAATRGDKDAIKRLLFLIPHLPCHVK